MLLPLSLLFVGAVLVLNGLWMTGRISDREIVVINFATASITGAVAILSMIRATTDVDVRAVAMTLLFSVTYLWVAVNRLNGADGRGLGWFSLFVSLSVLPQAGRALGSASGFIDIWLGLCWVGWSGLWFLYFVTLALRKPLQGQTAAATLASGVLTAWAPALVLLYGARA
jgi:hypothetical protein